jgi:hypothetical protein
MIYGGFTDYWNLRGSVTFDGDNRIIKVNDGVTAISIKRDIYSAWKNWLLLENNAKYVPAIRSIGGDPIGNGLTAGDMYFLINNWKLCVDLSKVQITGVLFSDNYNTAYYTNDLVAQYPAFVSSIVSGVSGLTQTQDAVLQALPSKLTTINDGVKKASLLVPHTVSI